MSDDTLSCKIDGCDYSGSPIGLRSHVHGTSDEQHTQAADADAWEDWYPAAYGIEPDSDDSDDDDEPDPSDDGDDDPDPEGGAGTAATTDSDDATPDVDPETVTGDADEYADQYRHTDDPEPDTVDAGTATPVEPDTPDSGGPNWGVLIAGAAALAGAVLLSGRSSDSGADSPPTQGDHDVPDDPNDALALTPETGGPESTGGSDSITMEDGEVFG